MRTADGFIIRKCLDGDSAAFGLLVDKYKGGVYALAYSKLGNFHDAEDVTQEVFIKAYVNLRSLRRWDSFHAWLYSITSNLCKDWIKNQSRRPDRDSIEEQEEGVLEALSISHHRDESLWESLRDLLDSQPESQRQVLTLYYLGGMNSNEIAEFLGTSPTAIRHRIHRARLKLKKEMLATMTGTFERKKLRASFTLRIAESVKHLKIQAMPRPIGPSWGISLIAGILLTVLSSGIQLNLIRTTDAFMESAVPIETTALRTGEFPVEFLWMGDSESHEPLDVKEPEVENLEMTTEDKKPAGLANYSLSETSSESKDDSEDVIVEPNSGLRFTRIISGPKLDVIGRSDYYMTVSRDGNFLFVPLGPGDRPPGWVIPLRQDQEPPKFRAKKR